MCIGVRVCGLHNFNTELLVYRASGLYSTCTLRIPGFGTYMYIQVVQYTFSAAVMLGTTE